MTAPTWIISPTGEATYPGALPMTDDLYALDKAVTEAKDRVVAAADAWGESDTTTRPSYDLADAVVEYRAALAAKRKAMTSTPLSGAEAHHIYVRRPETRGSAAMQAVLTACRERDLKLIEALPITQWNGHATVRVDAVRRALTSGGQ